MPLPSPANASLGSLTPMLRQYLEVKAEHPDAVLMYRMGDFYEMFFDDARKAAPILEVQLTARNRGTGNEAPMCGIPHHALEGYLAKLLAAGLKVAICDQVEDPAQARGLVRREVTRVLTPGAGWWSRTGTGTRSSSTPPTRRVYGGPRDNTSTVSRALPTRGSVCTVGVWLGARTRCRWRGDPDRSTRCARELPRTAA